MTDTIQLQIDDEQIRVIAARRQRLFKHVDRDPSLPRSLTEESMLPPLDEDMIALFLSGKLDDPNFDLDTKKYKPGTAPPKLPILACIPTPALPNVQLGGTDQLVVKDLKRKLHDAHSTGATQKLVIQDSNEIIARLIEVTTTLNSSDSSSQHYRTRVESTITELESFVDETTAKSQHQRTIGAQANALNPLVDFVSAFVIYVRTSLNNRQRDSNNRCNTPMSTTDSSIVRPYELTSTQFTAVARAFRNLSRLKGVFPEDDEYEVDIMELRETPNNFDSQLTDLVKRIKALLNNNNNGSDKRSINDIKQMRELSLLAHQQWVVGMDMAQVLRENRLLRDEVQQLKANLYGTGK